MSRNLHHSDARLPRSTGHSRSRSAVNNRILIADDEVDVLNLVGMNLSAAGFQVSKVQDGPSALAAARREAPALVVLDIMMPGMSGIEVCRELKRQTATAQIAIMFLSARREEVDRVLGFELGIDDYLTKPFSPRELVLRVKSILRRRTVFTETPDYSEVGVIAVDRKKHLVTIGGQPIQPTAIEYKLLCAFMEKPGVVLSRDDLLARVWSVETEIETRTVDTHLRRLRDKLGPAGDQIQTVRGFGYRINAE